MVIDVPTTGGLVEAALEIGAYLVPALDHALDVLATPAAALVLALLALPLWRQRASFEKVALAGRSAAGEAVR